MHSYDNYFLKFVTESTAYPVQYRKRKGALLYEASTYWVDPDIDNAAAHINEVWINEKLARAKAAYASEWLIETFSTNAVGTSMYKRLKVCWLCHNSHNVIYCVINFNHLFTFFQDLWEIQKALLPYLDASPRSYHSERRNIVRLKDKAPPSIGIYCPLIICDMTVS